MKLSDENILAYARKNRIDVKFVDSDAWDEGVHIYRPTPSELLEAVKDAIRYGECLVMIHDNPKTWPFSVCY